VPRSRGAASSCRRRCAAPEYALDADGCRRGTRRIGKPAEPGPNPVARRLRPARACSAAPRPSHSGRVPPTIRRVNAKQTCDVWSACFPTNCAPPSPPSWATRNCSRTALSVRPSTPGAGKRSDASAGPLAAAQPHDAIDCSSAKAPTIAVTEPSTSPPPCKPLLAGAADEAEMRGTASHPPTARAATLLDRSDLLGRAFLHALGAALKVASGLPLTITARATCRQIRIAVAGARSPSSPPPSTPSSPPPASRSGDSPSAPDPAHPRR
jgi:hypothetical protein